MAFLINVIESHFSDYMISAQDNQDAKTIVPVFIIVSVIIGVIRKTEPDSYAVLAPNPHLPYLRAGAAHFLCPAQ